MRMAVTDVYFMCDGRWYIQTDGVAMGSSLAVILANIWMKSFEVRISRQPPDNFNSNGSQDSYPCGTCMLEVLDEGFSICCDDCDRWFHLKCTNLTIRQLKGMDDNYWNCGCGAVSSRPKAKIFGRYVDDILRSVKVAETDRLLSYVNTLHPNLEFTIWLQLNGTLPFLDMLIRQSGRTISTEWYSKPTDTGLTLGFHACAPTKYKRNIVKGTLHRIDHSTSTWEAFDRVLRKAKNDWEANQFSPAFYETIVTDSLLKIKENHDTTTQATTNSVKPESIEKPVIRLQYRGKVSNIFAKRLQNCGISTIFTTRKLRTCLPTLKTDFPRYLTSRVVYEICCPGCNSCYVGPTVRHLITRKIEHLRDSAPVGSHLKECGADKSAVEARILDRCLDTNKLLTLEALYISRKRPALNTREEYRQRYLTVKMWGFLSPFV